MLTRAAELIALFLLYVGSARLGLSLGPVSGFAALVWPPTGIALAALLLRGVRVWPAVMLGAIVANVLTGATFWVAVGIGVGNTLEAVLAVSLLGRFAGFRPGLDRLGDVVALVALAAGLSTIVSATFGVFVLRAAGIVQPGQRQRHLARMVGGRRSRRFGRGSGPPDLEHPRRGEPVSSMAPRGSGAGRGIGGAELLPVPGRPSP